MNKFRYKIPKRRDNKRNLKNYSGYKTDLQKDFNQRCGYCDDLDARIFNRSFQIDHFVPKNSKYVISTIADNEYKNLVYSCAYCNRSKWDLWPTNDENKHHDGKIGFIDPCSTTIEDYLDRNEYGEIVAKNELGRYMRKTLKLYIKRHAVIRNIEKLDTLLEEIETFFEENKIEEEDLRQLVSTLFKFKKYTKFLRQ